MEKYKTIDEYIASQMSDQVVRRSKSPAMGLALIIVGALSLILMYLLSMGDTMQMLLLSAGIGCLIVGLVLTVLCFSKALWNYYYLPTGSTMKSKTHYLTLSEYQHCVDALIAGDISALSFVKPITSSNAALCVVVSRDGSIVLLQAGRLDTSEFECATPVVVLTGDEVAKLPETLR